MVKKFSKVFSSMLLASLSFLDLAFLRSRIWHSSSARMSYFLVACLLCLFLQISSKLQHRAIRVGNSYMASVWTWSLTIFSMVMLGSYTLVSCRIHSAASLFLSHSPRAWTNDSGSCSLQRVQKGALAGRNWLSLSLQGSILWISLKLKQAGAELCQAHIQLILANYSA